MDNRFENDYYGTQPQKPLNERRDEPLPQDPEAAYAFNPEKPLLQNPVPEQETPAQPAAQDVNPQFSEPQVANPQAAEPQNVNPQEETRQGANPQSVPPFNPISQTATYADNRFVDRQYPPQGQMPPVRNDGYYNPYPQPQPNPQPPYPPQPNAYPPQGAGYQQPPYGNRPNAPRTYAPYPERSGYSGDIRENPYERPAEPVQTTPRKNKVNRGLIVVIIVLSALLIGSVGGIIYLTFSQNHSGNSQKSSNNIGNAPIVENPFDNDGGMPSVPKTTNPQAQHKESDYSDKVQADYRGVELKELPGDKDDKKYDTKYAISQADKSVVSVMCYLEDENDVTSQGSGIVLTADGYVVTNAHVIGNSKQLYSVKIVDADGVKYSAGIVGFDSRTDIAVLKMDDAKNLKAAQFGNSDTLKQGDDIVIIGAPGGVDFNNSTTRGIVSALNRDASKKNIVKYIQTDAAINPGNSGGPAVNIYGQVIGIASAKIVDEKYEGMGFCIPTASAKKIIDDLMKNGYVSGRVKIGISGLALGSDEAQAAGISGGIYINDVTPDGPCDKAGVKAGEVVTAFDGKNIKSFSEIYELLEEHKPGDKVKIKLYNDETKKEREVDITLQEDK